jgi:ELWxxDGT repeat protein
VGVELWRSDGTKAGTTLFQDVNPGAGSSSPDNMTLSNGRMFFTASDGTHGFELWAAPMAPPGIRLLLSATGGLFPGGTVVLTLILENTGDFALIDGPGDELVFPIPPGLTLLSSMADRSGVTAKAGETVVWNGGLPPRGVATLEVTARVDDLPVGTEIVAHAAARFDTTGDGVAEPEVPSDDPATAEDRDATRIVLGLAPPEIPMLSLPGLLALAGFLAGAAGRLLRLDRRRPQPPPGSGSTPSSTRS